MTAETLRVALTKRALAKQLMRAGSPKREAEQVANRLTHAQSWRRLSLAARAEIAWKVTLAKAERSSR